MKKKKKKVKPIEQKSANQQVPFFSHDYLNDLTVGVIPLKYVEAVIHPVIVLSIVFAKFLPSLIMSPEISLFSLSLY